MKNHYQTYLTACLFFMLTFSSISLHARDIVVINGEHITSDNLAIYGQKRIGVAPGESFPQEKLQELIVELVNRELIYQDALALSLDKQPNIVLEIKEQIKNTITRVRINKLAEDNPPSDSQLKAAYNAQIVAATSTEYLARHILLDDEKTAKAIIKELNGGASFEELAKTKSTGPSASAGGDLGWFSGNQMVKPFSDAVKKLAIKKYTQRPINTRFGWHVIYLEDKRKVDPPPFESVKEQLVKIVQNKIINDYLEKLRDKASIEFK